MRTTISLDEDILAAARSLSHVQGQSLGKVLSELARKGLSAHNGTSPGTGGFPVFLSSGYGHPITSEAVRTALDEA